jgi:hypothetical protein
MGNNQKSELISELIFVLAFLAFFIFWQIEAYSFPKEAMIFPFTISGLGVILSFALLVLTRHRIKRTQAAPRGAGEESAALPISPTIYALASGFIYLVAVVFVGFLIGTLAVAVGACLLLRKEKVKVFSVMIFSSTLVLFIWVVFHLMLKVDFPKGLLFPI